MEILIVVRHMEELPSELDSLTPEDVSCSFCLGLDHAERRLRDESFDMVVMSGGVEPEDRGTVKAWCAMHQPSARVMDVYTRDALCDAVREAVV